MQRVIDEVLFRQLLDTIKKIDATSTITYIRRCEFPLCKTDFIKKKRQKYCGGHSEVIRREALKNAQIRFRSNNKKIKELNGVVA